MREKIISASSSTSSCLRSDARKKKDCGKQRSFIIPRAYQPHTFLIIGRAFALGCIILICSRILIRWRIFIRHGIAIRDLVAGTGEQRRGIDYRHRGSNIFTDPSPASLADESLSLCFMIGMDRGGIRLNLRLLDIDYSNLLYRVAR